MDDISQIETIRYFLVDKINSINTNISTQHEDLKKLIMSHINQCNKNMDCHNDRIKQLELNQNKAIGIIIGISSIAGIISGLIVMIFSNIWK